MIDQTMEVLDEKQCWELLEAREYGRLAFSVANSPDIVPINYHARGKKLFFRTASGSKLLAVTINHKIAFEYDEVSDGKATSVILYGTARELTSPEEKEHFELLPLHPWVATEKYHYVEVTADQISGRMFLLGGEPPEPEVDGTD
ncbi:hypothetical protein KEM60_02799 [Austwickia sp. TVS 96-490-7B]|uniref:pyridoxamine 5'-phosphate oxidase family protein n=1 Tax=Austwickia sp. TVS 96-490-7B TaxID=2830843 RepID=UPI001C59F8AE|nr:pyridoxamine 5'-phosphate oxidase family protein [Austwickia sp. TVS 96-490-7B]MBW3086571.1 hypothetical protein [Austwickia sp. TVS 96-490-7B]